MVVKVGEGPAAVNQWLLLHSNVNTVGVGFCMNNLCLNSQVLFLCFRELKERLCSFEGILLG